MNRGEIYWNEYKDSMGRERRVPVMVVSTKEINEKTDYVSAVRLVKQDIAPRPTHVAIPFEAIEDNRGLISCVALTETISSIRKGNMKGPAGKVTSPYYLQEISRGIRIQCGMEFVKPEIESAKPAWQGTFVPSKERPMYSAANSPQMRPTEPMQTEANEGE